jgi:DNA-binding Lrp family transcriptional regulator
VVVQAYILIQTEVGKAATVAGPYDVIARVEANTVDELGKLVIAKIQDVTGITRTLTCTVVHV